MKQDAIKQFRRRVEMANRESHELTVMLDPATKRILAIYLVGSYGKTAELLIHLAHELLLDDELTNSEFRQYLRTSSQEHLGTGRDWPVMSGSQQRKH